VSVLDDRITTLAAARLTLALAVMAAAACGTADKPAPRTADATLHRDSAAGTLAAPATATAVSAPTPPAVDPACAPENGGITLPAGFCATIFTDSAPGARGIAVAPNGDVFVNRTSNRGGGPVHAFRDTNGDGVADTSAAFGTRGGTGIGLAAGWVYVDEGARITRYPVPAGQLAPNGEPQVVVSGLPTGGHPARNFVLDGRGSLYVNVGSESNSCQTKDRANRVPGADPCVELETRAGIWRYRADTPNQAFSPRERYATGIRNGMGMAMNPADRTLYVAFHGRDQLSGNWGFSDQQNAELPAEELVKIQQGGDYGWPYCYYDGAQKKLVLAPEYGGDGKEVGRCASKLNPVVAFPAHWAPMSALFYTGSQFPAKYRSGIFVAFHGSWNRSPLPQAGYRVAFAPMTRGTFTGAYETFAGEFNGVPAPGATGRNAAAHRPVGLAQAPDGAIYVTDDAKGRIWKIVYTGR
jgi:glucose/arabinose dehydrogenase